MTQNEKKLYKTFLINLGFLAFILAVGAVVLFLTSKKDTNHSSANQEPITEQGAEVAPPSDDAARPELEPPEPSFEAVYTSKRARPRTPSGLADVAKTEEDFKAALAQIDQGKHEQAITTLEGIVAADPKNVAALTELGFAVLDFRQDFPAAREYLRQALELDSSDPFTVRQLSRIYERQNDPEAAITFYQKLIDQDPSASHIYSEMARLLNQTGAKNESLSLAKQTLQMNPTAARTSDYGNVAKGLLTTGNLGEAAEAFVAYQTKLKSDITEREQLGMPVDRYQIQLAEAQLNQAYALYQLGDISSAQRVFAAMPKNLIPAENQMFKMLSQNL